MTNEQRARILAFNLKRKIEGDMAADFRKLLDIIPPSVIKILQKDVRLADILAKYIGGESNGKS